MSLCNPGFQVGSIARAGERALPCDLPFLSPLSVSEQVSVNRSRLYRSPSMPEKLDRPVLKRIVRCQDNETPIKVKRRRSPVYEELEGVREADLDSSPTCLHLEASVPPQILLAESLSLSSCWNKANPCGV